MLSARPVERYERRLEQVDSLRELVAIAGELHAEDLELLAGLLEGMLEGMLDTLTPPPVAPPETHSE